jgi:hypothetical protein
LAGEKIEFASQVNAQNITIRVESGTYLEDYPIKVPDGVSIKGDEFRRVIIRPRNRISQSPWADIYFFRDLVIDGLTTATTNFGRHYLTDSTTVKDVGSSYTNAGNFTTEATQIYNAVQTIQNAVIVYVNSLIAPSSLNPTDEAETRRYTGKIVEALVLDLNRGGIENALEEQGNFYNVILSAQRQAGITYIATYVNASVIASASNTIKTVVTNAITLISYAFDPAYNPPKHNRDMDMFLMGEATIIRNDKQDIFNLYINLIIYTYFSYIVIQIKYNISY